MKVQIQGLEILSILKNNIQQTRRIILKTNENNVNKQIKVCLQRLFTKVRKE